MTVGELVDKIIVSKEDFGFYLGNFLDDFYAMDQKDRQKALTSPVCYDRNCRRELSLVAAVVEKLADDYGLMCPDWIFDRRYYSVDPVFPAFLERTDPEKKSKLRIVLMVESPPQFKVRNIFVSRNCLRRV